jgi:hypothetical protein
MASQHRFIGSTGLLQPNQCQNDIWLTQGNPNHPVLGDRRIILQAINPTLGVMYYEMWEPQVNDWEVWSMPGWIVAQDDHNPNPTVNVIVRNVIPNNAIANPRRGNGNQVILGYNFNWDTIFYLRSLGPPLIYIQHMNRRPQDQYLIPKPDMPQWIFLQKLKWGVQMNQFRAAWI